MLIVARILVPNPIGHGTHTQLGLPPCLFLAWTGQPCPACGLTTAFAHMARGELAAALHANVLGVMLFATVIAFVPIGVWAGVRKLPLYATLARVRAARIVVVLAGVGIVQWCARLSAALLH